MPKGTPIDKVDDPQVCIERIRHYQEKADTSVIGTHAQWAEASAMKWKIRLLELSRVNP